MLHSSSWIGEDEENEKIKCLWQEIQRLNQEMINMKEKLDQAYVMQEVTLQQ